MHDEIDQFQSPRGRLTYRVYLRGVLIDIDDGDNLITNQSYIQMARMFGGHTMGRSVSQIGFGSNGSAPAKDNTVLVDQFAKALLPPVFPAPRVVEFLFSLDGADANGLAIREFGLLSGDGSLLARRTRATPLIKTPEITLSGTWRVEF